MAAPIARTGPNTPNNPAPVQPKHPGFYTGNDPVLWATNLVACWRFNADGMASGPFAAQRAAAITKTRNEADMLEALLKRIPNVSVSAAKATTAETKAPPLGYLPR